MNRRFLAIAALAVLAVAGLWQVFHARPTPAETAARLLGSAVDKVEDSASRVIGGGGTAGRAVRPNVSDSPVLPPRDSRAGAPSSPPRPSPGSSPADRGDTVPPSISSTSSTPPRVVPVGKQVRSPG